MRISDWSSDVCSSDLLLDAFARQEADAGAAQGLRIPAAAHPMRGLASPYREQQGDRRAHEQIGRASCRERVCQYVYISVVGVSFKKQKNHYHLDVRWTTETTADICTEHARTHQ